MRHLALALLAYCSCVLQIALNGRLPVAPDFLLLTGAAALIAFHDARGIVWLAVLGLLGDCLADGRLGVEMGCATLIGMIIHRLWSDRPPRAAMAVAFWLFIIVFATRLAVAAVRHMDAGQTPDVAAVAMTAAAVAGVSAVAGVMVVVGRLSKPSVF